jgi:hypothetical protein
MIHPKHQALAQDVIRFLMEKQGADQLNMRDTLQTLIMAISCTTATVAEHLPQADHAVFVDAVASQIRALTHLNITRDSTNLFHTAGHG